MLRTRLNPGVSVGTRIMLARWCGGASGFGDGHDDGEVGAVGRRREPLLAVDHVVVAVLDGRRAHHHRVRARHLRLGHREAAADLAFDERAQVALPLLLGGVGVQDLDVAGIRRLNAEHEVAERAAAERLAQQPVLDHAQPEAAELDRMVRRPQPHLADLVLRAGPRRRRASTGSPWSISPSSGMTSSSMNVRTIVQDRLHLLGNVEVHEMQRTERRRRGTGT